MTNQDQNQKQRGQQNQGGQSGGQQGGQPNQKPGQQTQYPGQNKARSSWTAGRQYHSRQSEVSICVVCQLRRPRSGGAYHL